jgi:hypothetical protein
MASGLREKGGTEPPGGALYSQTSLLDGLRRNSSDVRARYLFSDDAPRLTWLVERYEIKQGTHLSSLLSIMTP